MLPDSDPFTDLSVKRELEKNLVKRHGQFILSECHFICNNMFSRQIFHNDQQFNDCFNTNLKIDVLL